MSADDIEAELQNHRIADRKNIIKTAQEADILISRKRLKELNEFFQPWTWGPVSAAFMFGYYTDSFVDSETELNITRRRKTTQSLLPEGKPVIKLPAEEDDGLLNIVSKRRSRRKFTGKPIESEEISACLQLAFGITGELTVENKRKLPLTGAPSPGGLNTYDAFLLARNVSGLKAGTYCYLPQKHGLVRQKGHTVSFGQLFGGQAWCDKAACAIVLVADLNRQASRYVFPTTLSASLIEAGARIELILLQAEKKALSATVLGMSGVGAFNRELAKESGLPSENSMKVPICAVLIGARP